MPCREWVFTDLPRVMRTQILSLKVGTPILFPRQLHVGLVLPLLVLQWTVQQQDARVVDLPAQLPLLQVLSSTGPQSRQNVPIGPWWWSFQTQLPVQQPTRQAVAWQPKQVSFEQVKV